jgi:hypothetical protein
MGSARLLTFHAGLLGAFSGFLTYDAKLPLYEVNYVIAPEAAASSLV